MHYVVLASPWGSVSYRLCLLSWSTVHEVLLNGSPIRGNGFSRFVVRLSSEVLLVPQNPQVGRLFLVVLGAVSKVLVESRRLLALGSQVASLCCAGVLGY